MTGKTSWLGRLAAGLKRSSSRLGEGIAGILVKRRLDRAALSALEDLLISADLGPSTAGKLVEELGRGRLDKEIGERTNVAADHPDVVKRLQALAAKMAEDLGDGKPGPGVRPAGKVANPTLLYPAEAVQPKKDGKKQ